MCGLQKQLNANRRRGGWKVEVNAGFYLFLFIFILFSIYLMLT